MMTEAQSRNLFASVATYATPPTAQAIEHLRDIFEMLIRPYTQDTDGQYFVQWLRMGSSRPQRASEEAVKWNKVLDGPLNWLVINAWRESNLETTQSPSVAAVTLHVAEDPKRASVFEVSMSKSLFGSTIDRGVQQTIVDWASTTFQAFEGIAGYITCDYVSANVYGSMSPYEQSVGLSYPWASLEFRTKARGYYWGNLLHASHVELLGGPGRLQEAPVAHVEPLGQNGYYLQLTGDINDIDRARLARLKTFLAPLLPEGYPQSEQYYAGMPDFLL